MKERLEDIRDRLVSGTDPYKLTLDEFLMTEDFTAEYVIGKAEEFGLTELLNKVKSLLHINNLNYIKAALPKDPMVAVIMKRLGAEYGYVEKRDVTSKGEALKLEVIVPNLLSNV